MKILFLMNHIIMGGLEKVLLQYLDVLCAKGMQCTVLSQDKVTDTYFLDFFKKHNVKFSELRNTKTHSHVKKPVNKLLNRLTVRRLVNRNDVVIDFANFSYTRELGKLSKRKIGYCHGSILFFDIAIDKKVLETYDDFVCLSDSFRSDLLKKYPQYANKVHRIYNPISAQNVQELSTEKYSAKNPFFVAVQRLDSLDKDVPTIIRAFNIFSKTHPRYSLYIIGDGPQRAELEKMAAKNKQIIFTGTINNPYPFIRNAKALILSSTTTLGEGLPNTLLEAQALGTLAISSNVPSGPHEILMDGKAGILFKPHDYKELANILTNIVNKKYDIDKITKTATKNLSRFNAENNVNRLLNLIQERQ